MTERTAVDLVEEWQTGAFLLLASALAGFVAASAVGRGVASSLGLPTFAGGAVLTFLVLSYLFYGR
ncbi:hypothetical protein [Halobacterium jilantaiense]|uniref:DUF8144 domain-containing protein n=1 Tax=Halobacterium jilantaiense TaxID=355548 RepID=A0A1I0PBW8_9EURY|nr:hypothetical protein [Halobacterium jilantaiense]SEW11852.1 hypothetical protein SAMN04487945_1578 [Halobacterium jilantaiense]